MELSTYYKEVVNKNDTFTGGWAPIYYGVLTKIINENNYKKVAEVGIGYGTHAKFVLKTTKLDKLYLVDPMCYYPNDNFVTDIMRCIPKIPNNHFNEMYELISQELSPWKHTITWFRTKSLDVTNQEIFDGELDCVFLDGDHSYDAVKKDLPFWWKKIRVGGKIVGDDYWIEWTARAVDEFAKENNLTTEFLRKEGTDYKIYVFTKMA